VDDTGEFLAAFDVLVQAIRRARGASGLNRESGLTLSQFGLLEPLADRSDARVSALAAMAGVTSPTATRILDALERRRLVTRRQASGDRRGVSIALTAAGRAAVLSERDWIRRRWREFYEDLPAGERALAPDLLLRLAALIDELAAGPE
jgi:MarR family transcriptional regulator, organic hydroperoxide resistance regulator